MHEAGGPQASVPVPGFSRRYESYPRLRYRNHRVSFDWSSVSGKSKTPPIIGSDEIRSGSLMGLNMLFEVVHNRLPAGALLFDGMRRLSVKRFSHRDSILANDELDN
jgi:hypothetical protein